MRSPDPFLYPATKHVRRHGPAGYAHYRQYRDWLRDEFQFRCVFCLQREQWTQLKGVFDIDHFQPQVLRPDLTKEYDNLLYACHTCNLDKGSRLIPDPAKHIYGECLVVKDDGVIEALNAKGEILIDELDLDSDSKTESRQMWIDIVAIAKSANSDLLNRLMGFPNNLPDLSKLRPPGGNTRKEGIENSWYARKLRGDIPPTIE